MENLTVQWVKDQVENIRKRASDLEAAHGLEDRLHEAVLEGISDGVIKGKVARECAKEALKTTEIQFKRAMA